MEGAEPEDLDDVGAGARARDTHRGDRAASMAYDEEQRSLRKNLLSKLGEEGTEGGQADGDGGLVKKAAVSAGAGEVCTSFADLVYLVNVAGIASGRKGPATFIARQFRIERHLFIGVLTYQGRVGSVSCSVMAASGTRNSSEESSDIVSDSFIATCSTLGKRGGTVRSRQGRARCRAC